MSLFQCDGCGCVENTALASIHAKLNPQDYDWTGIEHLYGGHLCSACLPDKFSYSTPSGFGTWHGEFNRVYLVKNEWFTNAEGNLENKKTGSTNFRQYAIEPLTTG